MPDHSTTLLAPDIAAAFVAACEAELQALKPGNVHVFAPGHDMDVNQFRNAAKAAAPIISDPTRRIGTRIKDAVAASMDAAGCNTNLGILLLCAPLAASVDQELDPSQPRARLAAVLEQLNTQDAEDVFAAIRRANPGGLGRAERLDVHGSKTTTPDLLDAMRLSASFDRIARAYISQFDDIFVHHLPALEAATAAAKTPSPTDPDVVTMLYMQMLQDFPDSHIGRKFGPGAASRVQRRAADLKAVWHPSEGTRASAEGRRQLLAFDQDLKAEGLNPGTTADFVVATLFAERVFRRYDAHESPKGPCPRPTRGAI